MSPRRSPHELAKYLAYILERRPDEFGLVPDSQGFLKIKELLKALREEPDFRSVGRGDLDEIRITLQAPPFEIVADRIRGRNPSHLPARTKPEQLPKLLYTCIRRRAYPHIHAKGIHPMGRHNIILVADEALAHRIGLRIDPEPVSLTIQTQAAKNQSVTFEQAGTELFLAPFIPPGCFSGPPLPKTPEQATPKPKPRTLEVANPGAFAIDPDRFIVAVGGGRKNAPILPGSNAPPSRKGKKRKRKRERPPWRQ